MRYILIAIVLLAIAGAVDSGYALKQHYAPPDVSACDYNETVSCTAVNQSEYSEVSGIPVAAIGIAGYLIIGILAVIALAKPQSSRPVFILLALASLGGFLVALTLTYIELFVLEAVCPLCVVSQALIFTILLLASAGAIRNGLKRR
ncbi:MAG: vitamin K epoxide reductase family protein [Actinobacteria bacterium]|nr:vitamin K epoxide reductase family protein [Actinomycetota bacterium]